MTVYVSFAYSFSFFKLGFKNNTKKDCKVRRILLTKTDGGVLHWLVKISCILSPELRLRDKGVLILNGPPVKSSTGPLLQIGLVHRCLIEIHMLAIEYCYDHSQLVYKQGHNILERWY